MAKQSGLHQIRGKIGEHSYYRQSGVASGLIRGINQGMSSRVKTSDEYANTRRNNAEFGAACNVAGLLGRLVVPKFRPMVLPFSQSKMAKQILDSARSNTGEWGKRVVESTDTATLAEILTKTSKLSLADRITISLDRRTGTLLQVMFNMTEEQVNDMRANGADGIIVKGVYYGVRTGTYSASAGRILSGQVIPGLANSSDDDLVESTEIDDSFELLIPAVFPTESGYSNHQFVTVILMPYRVINNNKYTLQELCCFQTFQLPAQE